MNPLPDLAPTLGLTPALLMQITGVNRRTAQRWLADPAARVPDDLVAALQALARFKTNAKKAKGDAA